MAVVSNPKLSDTRPRRHGMLFLIMLLAYLALCSLLFVSAIGQLRDEFGEGITNWVAVMVVNLAFIGRVTWSIAVNDKGKGNAKEMAGQVHLRHTWRKTALNLAFPPAILGTIALCLLVVRALGFIQS